MKYTVTVSVTSPDGSKQSVDAVLTEGEIELLKFDSGRFFHQFAKPQLDMLLAQLALAESQAEPEPLNA